MGVSLNRVAFRGPGPLQDCKETGYIRGMGKLLRFSVRARLEDNKRAWSGRCSACCGAGPWALFDLAVCWPFRFHRRVLGLAIAPNSQ